jgi:hypothetical protein
LERNQGRCLRSITLSGMSDMSGYVELFVHAEGACIVNECGEVTPSELIDVQSVVSDRFRQEMAKRHCERIEDA